MNVRRSVRSGGFLLGVCVAACATAPDRGLAPSPGVATAPGNQSAAVMRQDGVALVVDGDAWQGHPRNLEKELTPIRVVVRNEGTTPLLVKHKAFFLEGVAGRRVQAQGPFNMNLLEPRQMRIVPEYPAQNFFLADYLVPFYGTAFPMWRDTIAYEPGAYQVTWGPDLPTADMLNRSLPEGVLQPGGEVAGFVYFPALPQGEDRVVFHAELEEPKAGRDVAVVSIPFVVK